MRPHLEYSAIHFGHGPDPIHKFVARLWQKIENVRPLPEGYSVWVPAIGRAEPWDSLPRYFPPVYPDIYAMAGIQVGCIPTAGQSLAAAVLRIGADWWRGVKDDWQWARRTCGRECSHPIGSLRSEFMSRLVYCDSCGRCVSEREWRLATGLIITEADLRAWVVEVFKEFGSAPGQVDWS